MSTLFGSNFKGTWIKLIKSIFICGSTDQSQLIILYPYGCSLAVRIYTKTSYRHIAAMWWSLTNGHRHGLHYCTVWKHASLIDAYHAWLTEPWSDTRGASQVIGMNGNMNHFPIGIKSRGVEDGSRILQTRVCTEKSHRVKKVFRRWNFPVPRERVYP